MAIKFSTLWHKHNYYGKNLKINFIPMGFNGQNFIFMKTGRSAGTLIMEKLLDHIRKNKQGWSLGQGENDGKKILSRSKMEKKYYTQDYGDNFIKWLNEITDEEIKEKYFVFLNVRNPFGRVVSYFQATKHHYIPKDIRINDYTLPENRKYFNLFIKEHFLDSNNKIKKIPGNGHLWPSSIHYEYENGQPLANFVIKVENIVEDWKSFCSKTHIPYTPIENRKLIDYRPYFTPEQVEIVSTFYKRDLELFNYEF